MTTHLAPTPGSIRVCAVAAPGHMVAIAAPSIEIAEDIRMFVTAQNTIARTHGFLHPDFPEDAYVEQFDGVSWQLSGSLELAGLAGGF